MTNNINMGGWDYPCPEDDSIENLRMSFSGRGNQKELEDLSQDMSDFVYTYDDVIIPGCKLRLVMSESEMNLKSLASDDLVPCGCLQYVIEEEKISGKFQIQLFPGIWDKLQSRFFNKKESRFYGALVTEYMVSPADPETPGLPDLGGWKRYVIWDAQDIIVKTTTTSFSMLDPTISGTVVFSFEGKYRRSQYIHTDDISSLYHEFHKAESSV